MSDGVNTGAAPAAAKPVARKPLFKRVASKTQPVKAPTKAGDSDDSDDDIAFFSHKKDFIRQQRLATPDDRKKSTERRDPARQDPKRRKAEDSETDLYDVSDEEKARMSQKKSSQPNGQKKRPATPESSKKTESPPSTSKKLDKGKGLASAYSLSTPIKSSPKSDNAIVLSDSDDDGDDLGRRRKSPLASARTRAQTKASPSAIKPATTIIKDTDEADDEAEMKDDDTDDLAIITPPQEEEDEEIAPEYMRFFIGAREDAKKREAEAKAAAAAAASGNLNGVNAPHPDGPKISIFVTSELGGPEMKPIHVQRRVRQVLKPVREAVVSFAETRGRRLTQEEQETIILTWKGRKVFDYATAESLNISLDRSGKVQLKNPFSTTRASRGSGVSDGKLHFEAWTVETYAAWQKIQEKERKRDLGELVSSDEDEDDDKNENGNTVGAGKGSNSQGAGKLRLTLKSKDFEELKTAVSQTDIVADLVKAFRARRLADQPDKSVAMFFDGEKLEEDTAIGDTDVEDLDTIEVHIK